MDGPMHTTPQKLEDVSMPTERDLSDPDAFIAQVFERQASLSRCIVAGTSCRYVGIYQPGDFRQPDYRLVLPCSGPKPGRGYHGAWEEVFYASPDRRDVDHVIASLFGMVGEGQLVAMRHIINPSSNKDEGLRLIWAAVQDDASAKEEMSDWPRRDAMIQDGKTVQAEQRSEVDMDGGVGLGMEADTGAGMGAGIAAGMGIGYASADPNANPWSMGGMVPISAGGMGDPAAMAVAAVTQQGSWMDVEE